VPINLAGRQESNGALLLIGGLIVGPASTLLPWHTTSVGTAYGVFSGSHDAFGYWSGWIFLLAALVGLALLVARRFVPPATIPTLPLADPLVQLGAGVVMLLSALLWLVTGGGYVPQATSFSDAVSYSSGPSVGVFIGIIAGAAVVAGGYLMKADPQPATAPRSSHQSLSTSPPPAPPPPPAA
jgi:hypothetical protein